MNIEVGLRSKGTAFFTYGFVIHLVLMTAYLLYSQAFQGARLSSRLLLQLGVPSLGGLFVTLLFKPTTSRKGKEKEGLPIMFRLALHGLCATWLTLLVSFICIAVIASLTGPLMFAPLTFFFVFLGTVTYGMEPVILSMPLALAYGATLPLLVQTTLGASWADEWRTRCYRGGTT